MIQPSRCGDTAAAPICFELRMLKKPTNPLNREFCEWVVRWTFRHWCARKPLLELVRLLMSSEARAGTRARAIAAPINARIIDNFEQLGVDMATPRFAWVVNALEPQNFL